MTDLKTTADRVRAEGLISLEAAAALFPTRRGRPVTKLTVLRWILHGKRKVRLEAVRDRGEWRTSLAAVLRFREGLGL
jgi:hypothetical protein